MFQRILTETERKIIKAFLTRGGEKKTDIRTIFYRANKYLPAIESDLQLLKQLQAGYIRKQIRKKI
jgi:hypothetical protein